MAKGFLEAIGKWERDRKKGEAKRKPDDQSADANHRTTAQSKEDDFIRHHWPFIVREIAFASARGLSEVRIFIRKSEFQVGQYRTIHVALPQARVMKLFFQRLKTLPEIVISDYKFTGGEEEMLTIRWLSSEDSEG
jgi:hypothetical protein